MKNNAEIKRIEAKNLATGDAVVFPRIGKKIAVRLYSASESSVSFIFDDKKLRTFATTQIIDVDESAAPQIAGSLEIYRTDKATNRTSVVSIAGFRTGFPDVRQSFQSLRSRVSALPTSIALENLRDRRAALHTSKAIYRMCAG